MKKAAHEKYLKHFILVYCLIALFELSACKGNNESMIWVFLVTTNLHNGMQSKL